MPMYTVTSIESRLSQIQKNLLAKTIDEIHRKYTHVPAYFVQILFNDVKASNYFLGGKAITEDNICIHGDIRPGFGNNAKKEMVLDLISKCASVAAADPSSMEIYLNEIPHNQMTELGVILDEAGEDGQWESKLPLESKNRMQRILSAL